MATLTVKTLSLSDPDPGLVAAAAGGDEFAAAADHALLVENDDAASINVTLTSQVTAAPGVTAANLVVAVPAGTQRILPLGANVGAFKDTDGMVQVTYSAVTNVNVAAIKF